MFVRAFLLFLVLPSILAGLLPWMLAFIDPWRRTGWSFGFPAIGCGLIILLWCLRDFFVSGKGTGSPWDPPKHLVVVGLYRFTRNPMYIGVLLVVGGWAIVAGSPLIGAYLIPLAVVLHLRIIFKEEPWMSRQFGQDWARYSERVPRWFPRTARR